MVMNKVGKDIPQVYADQYGVFEGNWRISIRIKKQVVPLPPFVQEIPNFSSIREAIEKTGLKDGMTISFHHHFREGDYVMNMVLEEIAGLGIKNISIAPSSIANVHAPLIDHIKNGVVTNITSSGLRDNVGAAISAGIMENPVVIRSHGGRARAIAAGDVHIDVVFRRTKCRCLWQCQWYGGKSNLWFIRLRNDRCKICRQSRDHHRYARAISEYTNQYSANRRGLCG